ncbi:MAG TPA: hypothetical protein VKU87_04395 [Thermomicrobiaceae bacterium]|nr:hypothetical protein [Thermomicrobiaceae bacterium]
MSFTIPTPNSTSGGATPEGVYGVRLVSMDMEHFEDGPYGPQDRVKWIFGIEKVIDTDYDDPESLVGKEIWAFTSNSMHIMSTMRKHAAALLGHEIEDGENVQPSDLIGKQAKANVGPHTKKDGTLTTKLAYLQPVKGKRPAPVQAPDDDEVFD